MNKSQYDQLQQRELNEAITRLVELFPQLVGREIRLRSILTKLQNSSASNTRAYELLGLRDSDELHHLWGVSMRRVTAHCQTLHERFGVGRKFGKTWVLTADEAEAHRPAAKAGRPKKLDSQPTTKSRKARAEVCGVYAKAFGEFPLNEVIENYKRGTGHEIDGDMLAIGNAHNANKTNQEKHHEH